jgi:hypothetical protein
LVSLKAWRTELHRTHVRLSRGRRRAKPGLRGSGWDCGWSGATPGDEFPLVRPGWRRAHPPPVLPPEGAVLPRRLSLRHASAAVPARIRHTARWNRDLHLARPRVRPRTVPDGLRCTLESRDLSSQQGHSRYLAYTLFALVGIHLFTALWHQFVWRHRLLQRMWPAVSSGVRSRP